MSSVKNSRNLKKTIKKELESSNMLEEKVIEIPKCDIISTLNIVITRSIFL